MALFTACAQKGQVYQTGDLPPVITDPAKYNKLTPDEERIILHEGTERAFTGAYFNTKKEGIYICKQCNNPLFRSQDKFDSGTGWPSFYKPDNSYCVEEIRDVTLGMVRTEVLCARCGGHLGHVFDDGPRPAGLRYCMNSISLKFEKK